MGRLRLAWIAGALVIAGCGSAGSSPGLVPSPTGEPTSASTAEAIANPSGAPSVTPEPTTAPTPAVLEGSFDVGDHELYLRCEGSGSPTIVYFHGYIEEPTFSGASSIRLIASRLSDRFRVCAYDRANVGRSDDVPGPLTGETSIADLHALLAAAGIEPPYVLLGASFGGLLSYLYAGTYPAEVVGMVLLDAAFPDELALESLWPEEDRLTHDEFRTANEQLDQLAAYEQAQAFIGHEPAIPVTYLLATPSEWTGEAGDTVPPAYAAVVLDRIAAYVGRFSPGAVEEVRSPHYMEPRVPGEIAAALEQVIAEASR